MTRKETGILVALLLAHAALLAIFVSFRVLDPDEGFYLNATRMVGLGKSLYTDFFYTQMPLMPAVFGKLATNGWTSFWLLRGLAATAGFVSVLFLFGIVRHLTKNNVTTLVAVGLYCFSGLVLTWHSEYKPLPFAQMLALGTFYFWMLYHNKRRLTWLILSGIFLSLAINLRAVYIVLLPLFASSILVISKYKLKSGLIFFLSLIPGAVPTLMYIFRDFDRFFYDTFVFQLHRADSGELGYIISNKLQLVLKTIADPHLLFVFTLAGISVWLMVKKGKLTKFKDFLTAPEGMAVGVLALIAFIYFVPNPILRQYVEQFFVFAIIVGSVHYKTIWEAVGKIVKVHYRNLAAGAVVAIYCLSIIPYIGVFLLDYRGGKFMYRLSEAKKITGKMLEYAQSTDTVLAEWAGYPFLTGQTPLPYTELLGFQYPLPLDHDGYMHYKLADYEYLKEEVTKKVPRLVVTVNRVPAAYAEVLKSGYNSTYTSGNIAIHTRR